MSGSLTDFRRARDTILPLMPDRRGAARADQLGPLVQIEGLRQDPYLEMNTRGG